MSSATRLPHSTSKALSRSGAAVVAPNPFQTFRDRRFFGSLDGLRAVSILGVIWLHTWIGTPQFEWLDHIPVLRSGGFGVDIFFALSGFLITTLLLREEERFGTISLRSFYVRRALRIWPLYYTVLAGYVILTFLTGHGEARSSFFYFLPGFATFTYNWLLPLDIRNVPHFHFAWSLTSEEQFYVFWPLTLALLRQRRAQVVLAALICLKAVRDTELLRFAIPFDSFPDRVIATIQVPICLGVLLGCTLHRERGFRKFYPILGNRWSAPIALGILAVSLIRSDSFWSSWSQWLVLPFLVGACVIREDNGLAPVLSMRALSMIGVVSYGMYLLNPLLTGVARSGLGRAGVHHPLVVFPFAAGLSFLAASISYRYFEARFLRLKERWAR
jgi:peptidoglycan/LPS O-acetylase OafA/YrhL